MSKKLSEELVVEFSVSRCNGPNLVFRLIEQKDAEYVYSLRTDPEINVHLSAVVGTVDDQRQWIEDYKEREAADKEYYYVIERFDGLPCGLVRLYEIENARFTWGSWILVRN